MFELRIERRTDPTQPKECLNKFFKLHVLLTVQKVPRLWSKVLTKSGRVIELATLSTRHKRDRGSPDMTRARNLSCEACVTASRNFLSSHAPLEQTLSAVEKQVIQRTGQRSFSEAEGHMLPKSDSHQRLLSLPASRFLSTGVVVHFDYTCHSFRQNKPEGKRASAAWCSPHMALQRTHAWG